MIAKPIKQIKTIDPIPNRLRILLPIKYNTAIALQITITDNTTKVGHDNSGK